LSKVASDNFVSAGDRILRICRQSIRGLQWSTGWGVFEQAALSVRQMPIRRPIVWRLQPLACRWRFLCEAHPGHYEVRAGGCAWLLRLSAALFFAYLWPCWDLRFASSLFLMSSSLHRVPNWHSPTCREQCLIRPVTNLAAPSLTLVSPAQLFLLPAGSLPWSPQPSVMTSLLPVLFLLRDVTMIYGVPLSGPTSPL
jgi:hypothetical protein